MSLLNQCPLPGALVSVPETSCPVITGQIAKLAFQIIQDIPSFTKVTIATKATWSPLLAATTDDKVVLTPMLSNCVIPASELNTEGGNDNTTVNGIRNVKGLNAVTGSAQVHNITAATKAALQGLFPFSKAPMAGVTQIWVYPITTDGKVLFKNTGEGFPVYNVALSDPALEGFNKDNVFNLSFDLEGGWSDGLDQVSSDFKPLTFKNPS